MSSHPGEELRPGAGSQGTVTEKGDYLFIYLRDKVSLRSSGELGTRDIAQVDLKLHPSASTSGGLPDVIGFGSANTGLWRRGAGLGFRGGKGEH